MRTLGDIYYLAQAGVAVNLDVARQWYNTAVAHGDAHSKYILGKFGQSQPQ